MSIIELLAIIRADIQTYTPESLDHAIRLIEDAEWLDQTAREAIHTYLLTSETLVSH